MGGSSAPQSAPTETSLTARLCGRVTNVVFSRQVNKRGCENWIDFKGLRKYKFKTDAALQNICGQGVESCMNKKNMKWF